MKISLIHPSRGRSHKARNTLNFWMDRTSGNHEIEYILSLDEDDSHLETYQKLFKGETIIISDNDCVVKATNKAARKATGDILIYFSDDFQCPEKWDELIYDKVHRMPFEKPWLLKVNDGLQPFNVDVLTIPIMSKGLYKKLGYFWHPDYKSMFVDQDLYHTCKINKWLVHARDIIFPHLHWCNKKSKRDETYIRSNDNWSQGASVYKKRSDKGFPL